MIIVFIFGLAWQTVIIVHFYANRAKITAEHCINKKNVESHCKGSCHLKKQLSIESDNQKQSIPQHFSGSTGLLFLLGINPNKQVFSVHKNSGFKSISILHSSGKTKQYSQSLLDPPRFC